MIRPVGREDLETLRQFRNDPRVSYHFRNPEPISLERHIEWWESLLKPDAAKMYVILDGDKVIGACGLCYPDNRMAELSAYIGARGYDTHGRHLHDAVASLLLEAKRLGFTNIWAETYKEFPEREEMCRVAGMTKTRETESSIFWETIL